MTLDRRLERMVTALDGRERAIMFLREYKDGTTLDPGSVGFLDQFQRKDYDRLVDIIRLCNGELTDIIMIIKEQVTQQELRLSSLRQMEIHASHLWAIGRYLKACVKETVTERERQGWKGKAPGQGFDVRPDEDADEVEALRKNRQLVDRMVARGGRLKLPLDLSQVTEEPKGLLQTATVIAFIVREALASYWTQLQAVSTVLDEFREEFNGEDPLKPQFRAYLDDALQRIVECKDELLDYIGAWELPDDHARALATTRQLVERVLG